MIGDVALKRQAFAQVREALLTLHWAADGFHEDEAQVAMDALDWIEAELDESDVARETCRP